MLHDLLTSKRGLWLNALSRIDFSDQERKLTVKQRYVVGGGTEPPFSGRFTNGVKYNTKRRGTFNCAVCGLPAYSSSAKFKSGTGWPSFFDTIDPEHVWETTDISHGMVRRNSQRPRLPGISEQLDLGPTPATGVFQRSSLRDRSRQSSFTFSSSSTRVFYRPSRRGGSLFASHLPPDGACGQPWAWWCFFRFLFGLDPLLC